MANFAAGPGGAVYLSWIDPEAGKEHALRFARWENGRWSAPETVARGGNWFANWADVPAMQALADGTMLAHWLTRPEGAGTYGYGIRFAQRSNHGQWRETAARNVDDLQDYAGFVSFAGGAAAYLAPPAKRQPAAAHGGHGDGEDHIKTLRFARFDAEGKPAEDIELDGDVCSCCPTSTVRTAQGVVVAYRDHLPGEIRDISVVRYAGSQWSKPQRLHSDGWQINGCPTEGPALAARGIAVHAAWMTRAGGSSKLQLAMSADGGATFGAPVRADDGNALGRPALAADGREAVLVWLEKTANGAEVRARRVGPGSELGDSVAVAAVSALRSTGIPRVAVAGGNVIVAWRDDRVRTAWRPLTELPAPQAPSSRK
jgi:hypothetical protein